MQLLAYTKINRYRETDDEDFVQLAPTFAIPRALIAAGADVNAAVDGQNMLHMTCKNHSFKRAHFLLENGAGQGVNRVSPKHNTTALMEVYDLALFDALIDGGASVSFVGHKRFTAMSMAIVKRRTDILRRLIAEGVDVNQMTTWKLSKVKDAVSYITLALASARNVGESHEIVHMLVEAGSDVERESGYRIAPLFLAAQAHDDTLVKLFLTKVGFLCRYFSFVMIHVNLSSGPSLSSPPAIRINF